jgi:hypothetical protein
MRQEYGISEAVAGAQIREAANQEGLEMSDLPILKTHSLW